VTDDVAPPGAGPRLVVDWHPAEGWSSLTPEEAADLRGLLDRLLAEHGTATPALSVVPRRSVAGTRRRSA
jgi:hypothetical protein